MMHGKYLKSSSYARMTSFLYVILAVD